MGDKKLLIIGVDGATFDVIYPLMKKGRLPNFKRLIENGVHADLISTIPPITPAAWTSLTTGKYPDKHGLFDFDIIKKSYTRKIYTNSTYNQSKPVWRLLNESGKEAIVIDVPYTYPVERVKSFIFCRPYARPDEKCVYPKRCFAWLRKHKHIETRKRVKKITLHHDLEKMKEAEERRAQRWKGLTEEQKKKRANQANRRVYKKLMEAIDKQVSLVKYLKDNRKWDLFFVVFMQPDNAGHGFWEDQKKVFKIYEKVDEAIGKLFNVFGEDINKLIVSDHGFKSVPYEFYIDEWLYKLGLLKKTFDLSDKRQLKLMPAFKEDIRAGKKNEGSRVNILYKMEVDHKNSKAFLSSGPSYGIRINLRGRDPEGAVEPGEEYERIRDFIIESLRRLKNPFTKKRFITKIYKRHDIYSDKYIDISTTPDIIFFTKGLNYRYQSLKNPAAIFDKTPEGWGWHDKKGILLARGADIAKGVKLGQKDIVDICPTALHMMGEAIPQDCDGKVMRDIFKQNSPLKNSKESYRASSQIRKKTGKRLSAGEENAIKEKLAALGYIG